MYSLFDLDIGAVIRESADCILETLDITDRIDDEQVNSNEESTLDFIVVDMPALLESCNHGTEEPARP
jgi:chromosome condensin MukBEF complex kleisin-like MukF subunit